MISDICDWQIRHRESSMSLVFHIFNFWQTKTAHYSFGKIKLSAKYRPKGSAQVHPGEIPFNKCNEF